MSAIKKAILAGLDTITAKVISENSASNVNLEFKGLSDDERKILIEGCLMNYYAR